MKKRLLLALAIAWMSSSAQATLIYDLEVSSTDGSEGFLGNGQISFNSNTGTNVSGIDNFFFTPTSIAVANPQPTFTDSDIISVSWNILGDILDSFSLIARIVNGGETREIGLDITDGVVASTEPCGTSAAGPLTANYYCRATDFSISGAEGKTLSVEAVRDVPSPATLPLIGLGLAGLSWLRRKPA